MSGVKWPGREADHWPVSSAEVKNKCPVRAVVGQTGTTAHSPVTEADLIDCCLTLLSPDSFVSIEIRTPDVRRNHSTSPGLRLLIYLFRKYIVLPVEWPDGLARQRTKSRRRYCLLQTGEIRIVLMRCRAGRVHSE